MALISSPFGRAGSKMRLAPWILSIISHVPHQKFGELFAGSCALTLNKRAVKWEFLNDRDRWISDFLSLLRNREQKAELLRRLRYSAWEEADYEQCTNIIKGHVPRPNDPVEVARVFLINNCMSFNRSGRTFSISDGNSGIGKWKRIADHIERMARRIRDCTILNRDFAEVLQMKQINDPQMLIYADAPYCGEEKAYYAVNKIEGFDHHAFRKSLDQCKASLLISYQDHAIVRDIYRREDGWITKEAEVTRSLGNSGKRVRELLIVRKSAWSATQQSGISESGKQDFFGLEGEPLVF